ncbi:MAG: S8 family serine peptidase [Anaerolineales bacterium]|nr:S8 family serine peptidase [Anaerolineales bacterium]
MPTMIQWTPMITVYTRRLGPIVLLLILVAGACLPPFSRRASAADAGELQLAWMLELDGAPAAQIFAAQRAGTATSAAEAVFTTQRQIATLEAAQAALRAHLKTMGVPVLYTVQRVYNGVAVLAPASLRGRLHDLPGVKAVHWLAPMTPDNVTSVPYIGAPALWQDGAQLGVRGEGVRIAIIDTGIDYLHVDFAGPGSGYLANDTTRLGDVPGFPGPRIVGGYDFAGNLYDANPSSPIFRPIPQPDPDPMDCYGHGTHVAGTAAGSGVDASGATYGGPYSSDSNLQPFKIGPGVAPRADIFALKVFGCTGSTNLTELAIEWAVDPNGDGDFSDRMDVINLSLGSPYGLRDDPSAMAVDNAAAAGIIVVASAGNRGDSHLVTGSPATADSAISVAASDHHRWAASGPAAGSDILPTFTSRGPRRRDVALKPDLAAPGVGIFSASSGTGSLGIGNSGTSMAAPHVAGAVALLHQLHPTWSAEEIKAAAMNTAMPLVRTNDPLTSTLYAPPRIGAGRIDLTRAAQTSVLAMNAAEPGRVSISFGAPEVTGMYTAIKPLAVVNEGNDPVSFTPIYYPVLDLPGATVKSERQRVTVAPGVREQVDLIFEADAAQLQHIGDSTMAPVGTVDRSWLAEESGHLYLWPEHAPFTVTLAAAHTGAVGDSTAMATFDAISHTLRYTIELDAIAAQLAQTATLALGRDLAESTPLHRLWVKTTASPTAQITGTIQLDAKEALWLTGGVLQFVLQSEAAPTGFSHGQLLSQDALIHVPIYAAPRPAAELAVQQAVVDFDRGLRQPLNLQGIGLRSGTPPTNVVPLLTPLALQLRSPQLPIGANAAGAAPLGHADLQFVGVGVNAAGDSGAKVIYFGLTTYASWSTPNEVQFRIAIDTDRDGAADYLLSNGNAVSTGAWPPTPSDRYMSVLRNISTGATSSMPLGGVASNDQDPGVFFRRAMVLSAPIGSGGLALHGEFVYWVETFSMDGASDGKGTVDVTPHLRYDAMLPALAFEGPASAPPYAVDPESVLYVTLDPSGYASHPPLGILLLHHHNRIQTQSEVVPFRFTWPDLIHLPWVGKGEAP